MAVRIRVDGTIVCAATSKERDGDVYIDDSVHYCLGVDLRVMSVKGVDDNGSHLWEFHPPISMDDKIAKERKAMVGYGLQ